MARFATPVSDRKEALGVGDHFIPDPHPIFTWGDPRLTDTLNGGLFLQGVSMQISSDLPTPALRPPVSAQASESREVGPDHDGDADDAGPAKASLKPFQGTKIDTTA